MSATATERPREPLVECRLMRLYAGPSTHFIRDTTHNQIAEKLRTAFFEHYRYVPSPNEVQSWQNSLRATAMVFQEAELNDHGVILEYQLPLSSRRLDCIVTGHDRAARANAVIMELKQWSAVDGASVVGDKVVTWVGGGHRDVLHPSVQAGQYRQYLADNHEVFHANPSPIGLSACAYGSAPDYPFRGNLTFGNLVWSRDGG